MLSSGVKLWRRGVFPPGWRRFARPRAVRGSTIDVCPAAVETLETRALLSAGSLDPAFGIGGRVTTDFGLLLPSFDEAYAVAAFQSDGKSIVVGSSEGDVVAVRYNADGSLDAGFGNRGKVLIDLGGSESGFGVAVDSKGRILIAGQSFQLATGFDFAVARLTATGALDAGFGAGGRQLVDFGNTHDFGFSVAVDSQDRVLVAGYSHRGASGTDFAVARLTTTGALDTGFDADGKQTIDFASSEDFGQSLTVDAHDRVLVAGYSQQGTSGIDFAVARLTAAGTLDAGFDGDGKRTIDFGSSRDYAFSVAIDSQERILVGGHTQPATGVDFAVARLIDSGALDSSFDLDGKQTIDFGSSSDQGYSVAVDASDRVLMAGYSDQWRTGRGWDFAVARLTTAGALDTGFDADGRQLIDFGNTSDVGRSVAVDAQGGILVAGYSYQGFTGSDFAVSRLTATGALDAGFDVDGKVLTDIGRGAHEYASGAAAYQADGRFIAVGTSDGDIVAVRYNADGSLDATFGTAGVARVDFGDFESGFSVAIDSQGRILVAGHTYRVGTGIDFAVARLLGTGALDTSFGNSGKQTIDFANHNDFGVSVAIDSQGRVLVAGYSHQGTTGNDFAVARLTATGVLDTEFGNDGRNTIDFGNSTDYGSAVAVDSLNRVLVAGSSYQGATGWDFAVARLNSTGTLDTGFDADGRQTIDFGSADDSTASVAVDLEDRVLVAGYSYQGANGYDFAVARLNGSGGLDDGFSSDGKLTVDFGSWDDGASGVALDSEDRILLAGSTYHEATGYDFAVARLSPTGILDSDFGTNGRQTVDFGSPDDRAKAAVIDLQDRVLVVGESEQGATGRDFAVARLLAGLPNQPPSADDQIVAVAEDGSVQMLLSGSDPESPQSELTFTVTALSLERGSLYTSAGELVTAGMTFIGQPTLVYAPCAAGDGPGTETVTFTVTDPQGLTSEPATVTIVIVPAIGERAVSFDPLTGIVRIGGSSGNDAIVVGRTSDKQSLQVRIAGKVVSNGLPLATVREIRVWGREGHDRIEIAELPLNTFLHGGAGNDTIVGGSGRDVIFGGQGDDDLTGEAGNDLLVGGHGSDRLLGSSGHDVLVGGEIASRFTLSLLDEVIAGWSADPDGDHWEADLTDGLIDDASDTLNGGTESDLLVLGANDKVTGPAGAAGSGKGSKGRGAGQTA